MAAGEINNLARVCLSVIACFSYTKFLPPRVPPGKWRLISLLPIFYVFLILPHHATSAFPTAVIAFFFTWLANFKLLLFAFDRGPLASPLAESLPAFIALAAFPFTLKPQATAGGRKSKTLPLYLPTEVPIAVVLISLLYDHREHLHPQIVLVTYCCLVFLMIEILVELSSLLVRVVLGLELEPASDEPYLATSLREFWGRRWNLTVTNLLRQTVFTPVRSATAPLLGRDCAAFSAVLATFLVSGLMHELIFWYVSPTVPPSWEMTMFFVVQGAGAAPETGLKVAAEKKRRRVPWWVSGPLTLGFVVGTSFWLFFPPVMRSGADVKTIEECRFAGEALKGKMMKLWERVGSYLDILNYTTPPQIIIH